jgi:hypothetical protein
MVMVSSLVAKASVNACEKRDNNSNKALWRDNDIVNCVKRTASELRVRHIGRVSSVDENCE